MTPLPFDALAVVLRAAARMRTIPGSTYTPPATADDPNPAPVVTPEKTVIDVDPDDLPPVMVRPDGRVSLTQQVAMLQEAVRRQRQDVRLRSVHGQAVLTSGTVAPGAAREVPVLWETVPLAAVEAAIARMDVGVAWQGRVSARIKDGSITTKGCTVVVDAVGPVSVVVTAALPLTVHADGLYTYLTPYGGTT